MVLGVDGLNSAFTMFGFPEFLKVLLAYYIAFCEFCKMEGVPYTISPSL